MRFFTIASVLFTAAVGVLASPVVERQTPQSAAVVLTDLSNIVTPLADQLLYATSDNATQGNLTPIISEISTAVTDAVNSLNLLVGQPLDVILLSVDGVTILTVAEIAAFIGSIVNLIFNSAYAVLLVVESTIYSIIYGLLAALGAVVFSLLAILLSLIPGLLTPLLVQIASVEYIITFLGLTTLLAELLAGTL